MLRGRARHVLLQDQERGAAQHGRGLQHEVEVRQHDDGQVVPDVLEAILNLREEAGLHRAHVLLRVPVVPHVAQPLVVVRVGDVALDQPLDGLAVVDPRHDEGLQPVEAGPEGPPLFQGHLLLLPDQLLCPRRHLVDPLCALVVHVPQAELVAVRERLQGCVDRVGPHDLVHEEDALHGERRHPLVGGHERAPLQALQKQPVEGGLEARQHGGEPGLGGVLLRLLEGDEELLASDADDE